MKPNSTEVMDIVMLRHRHNDHRSVNWPSVFDDLAKSHVDHAARCKQQKRGTVCVSVWAPTGSFEPEDLDSWFRPLTEPAIALKKRRVMHDLFFEAGV